MAKTEGFEPSKGKIPEAFSSIKSDSYKQGVTFFGVFKDKNGRF